MQMSSRRECRCRSGRPVTHRPASLRLVAHHPEGRWPIRDQADRSTTEFSAACSSACELHGWDNASPFTYGASAATYPGMLAACDRPLSLYLRVAMWMTLSLQRWETGFCRHPPLGALSVGLALEAESAAWHFNAL